MTNEPSRAALKVQVDNLRREVASLRHFLRTGDSRMAFHLWVLWRADAWRHRHRADAFAAQLRAAGIEPAEPEIPQLPDPSEHEDTQAARWLAQIDRTREANTEEDAA